MPARVVRQVRGAERTQVVVTRIVWSVPRGRLATASAEIQGGRRSAGRGWPMGGFTGRSRRASGCGSWARRGRRRASSGGGRGGMVDDPLPRSVVTH